MGPTPIMRTDLFDFDLPEAAIALEPVSPRDAARLLVVRPSFPLALRESPPCGEGLGVGAAATRRCNSTIASSATSLTCCAPATRSVFNDTRVIRAALQGERMRGENRAAIAFNLHKRVDESRWRAFAQAGQAPRRRRPHLASATDGRVPARQPRRDRVPISAARARSSSPSACTAPTSTKRSRRWATRPAALHRRQARRATRGCRALPDRLRPPRGRGGSAHGRAAFHAGAAGSAGRARHLPPFRHAARRRRHLPARQGRRYGEHRMHAEWGEVSADTAAALNATRAAGGRIVAVGTTSLRLLETAADEDGTHPAVRRRDRRSSSRPATASRRVDLLMTNFHLPRSTLFMLVAAFSRPRHHAGRLRARASRRLSLLFLRRCLPAHPAPSP